MNTCEYNELQQTLCIFMYCIYRLFLATCKVQLNFKCVKGLFTLAKAV